MHGLFWLLVVSITTFGVLAVRPGVSPSRRVLAGALVALVPLAGPVLAMLVRRTRGGKVALEPSPGAHEPRLSAADVRRLGDLPPVLERLVSSDPNERLSALVDLSGAGDAAAVAVLRWTIAHGPGEVVLDAALTLEEIDLHVEARTLAAQQALAAVPTFERAVETADAVAASVLTGLADPGLAPALASQARDLYRLALELEPERSREVEENLARLELAAFRPRVALEILERLVIGAAPEDQVRLAELRDDAAFAAREFGRLSFTPRAPSDDLAARARLQRARTQRRATQPGADPAAMRQTGA